MKRETAWKIFAGEYNDSEYEIKGEGEMDPSYVITPLGAKVNRMFLIGVLTDVENISENGELVRAHISDPTGVFTLYSGEYQKDVTDILLNIDVPTFVAVVGKSRTYIPEEGTFLVSVRPERIVEVDADIRDKWILETCKNTKERIEAVFEAMKMEESNVYQLKKLGYSQELSEGIYESLKKYGKVDLNKYIVLIQESLQYIVPGKDTQPDLKKDDKKQEKITKDKVEIKIEENKTDNEEEDKKDLEIEKTVLKIIKNCEGEEGAAWDLITEECKKQGIDDDLIEEALNSLMDKGLIYEPILGTIKTT
jgi:RPA family protein